MPTTRPPKPDPNQELTERRIAEFALEESRLSNVAYRFELRPRPRVWSNWDRTEFEENRYRTLGVAGVCLKRDEIDQAHRAATRALEEVDDILFLVGEPARGGRRPGRDGHLRDHAAGRRSAPRSWRAGGGGFDRALAALETAFPGAAWRERSSRRSRERVASAGSVHVRLTAHGLRLQEHPMTTLIDHLAGQMAELRAEGHLQGGARPRSRRRARA